MNDSLLAFFRGRKPTLDVAWSVIARDCVNERRLGPPRDHGPSAGPGGAFAVGESIRLDVRPDRDGFLQVWNLGTSGRVKRLLPCPELGVHECRVEAGRPCSLPGALLPLPPPNDRIRVCGPTTAETGRNDILLVILTRVPVTIDPVALGAARPAFSTRGGFAAAEEGSSSLSDLPDEDWTYGLLETEVTNG
jgi:hypothetical protein